VSKLYIKYVENFEWNPKKNYFTECFIKNKEAYMFALSTYKLGNLKNFTLL